LAIFFGCDSAKFDLAPYCPANCGHDAAWKGADGHAVTAALTLPGIMPHETALHLPGFCPAQAKLRLD